MTNAAAGQGITTVENTLSTILCVIINLLIFISGGIATLIIVLNGIKWIASGDDAGALKQAREGIVHAIVGLIIVLVAVSIVVTIVAAAPGNFDTISGC